MSQSTLESGNMKNIVIAVAMETEAAPFVSHLSLKEDDSFFSKNTPFKAFTGTHESCHLTVITNGKDSVYDTGVDNVGTVPASLATYLALEKLDGQADLVINAGTCGGFKRKGAEIGDVFLTTASANHDRRIQIPGFEAYGVGLLDSIDVTNLAKALDAKTGVCTTGNSLDKTDEDDKHMKENEASVKDMEAAGIAWSCKLHGTPHFGVKVVTDIVDGGVPTQDEFLANLQTAAESLQSALPKVIAYICQNTYKEL